MVLVIGVNGAGKTTTIGKMAKGFADQGHKVMLAAGDTFPRRRGGAIAHLERAGRGAIGGARNGGRFSRACL